MCVGVWVGESKEGGQGNIERAYFWAHGRILTFHVLPSSGKNIFFSQVDFKFVNMQS